jgi:hypothetical protein
MEAPARSASLESRIDRIGAAMAGGSIGASAPCRLSAMTHDFHLQEK